jgi:hypothetical protein
LKGIRSALTRQNGQARKDIPAHFVRDWCAQLKMRRIFGCTKVVSGGGVQRNAFLNIVGGRTGRCPRLFPKRNLQTRVYPNTFIEVIA